jgi:hypothetical protein
MDDEIEDLFGEVPQPQGAPVEQRKPLTAEDVREQMLSLIDQLRAAETVPFEAAVMNKHIAMFPIMAQWLTPEDGEQLVFQFEAEVERLLKAA